MAEHRGGGRVVSRWDQYHRQALRPLSQEGQHVVGAPLPALHHDCVGTGGAVRLGAPERLRNAGMTRALPISRLMAPPMKTRLTADTSWRAGRLSRARSQATGPCPFGA